MPASELPASSSSDSRLRWPFHAEQSPQYRHQRQILPVVPPAVQTPRVLVHTAGRHQRVNLPRLHWRHHRFINMNSFPLIRQKDKRPGQLYTAHFQSAVMKVVLQNGCHVMMEIAKRLHQPR